MQKFVPGSPKSRFINGVKIYSNRVQIISLDQFIAKARKACCFLYTPRQLVTRLLQLPVCCPYDGCTHAHQLIFVEPNGTEVLFWLEK